MDQTVPAAAIAHDDASARRNAVILACAGAINGSNLPIAITLGGLAGFYLLGADKSLATLPITGYNVGVALGAIPAAMLMRFVGRRLGFMGGSLVAMAGGATAWLAMFSGSFLLLVLGLALVGFASAFAQQYRFAAADAGSPGFRARAISIVLLGGIAAAIIGPQTVILTRDLFAPIPFAGAFAAMIVLAFTGLIILTLLGGAARRPPSREELSGGRPLREIARQPRFIVAVICGVGSFAMMALVMTAAPLAMVACGLGQDNAALGIQWHVLAMFGPSLLTGRLIARFGVEPIIAAGMAMLVGCALAAISGLDRFPFLARPGSPRPRLEFRLHRRHDLLTTPTVLKNAARFRV